MIGIKLKCSCTPTEEILFVRERHPGEEIASYMNFIQRMAGHWHTNRSPLCMSTKLEYLKIPVDENAPIGAKSR